MANANSLWTMNLGATYHIARDREIFVKYGQMPYRRKWLYVENNTSIEVKEVRTCKLELHGG